MAGRLRDSGAPTYANSRRDIATIRKSPEERVRWLLKFSQAPAPKAESELRKARELLFFVQTGVFYGNYRVNANYSVAVLEAHRLLRDLFDKLAKGRSFSFDTPGSLWVFTPPPARTPGARLSAHIDRSHSQQIASSELPAAVIFKTVDLLDEVGADRLKACPLVVGSDNPPCGAIFLAKGRKKFCMSQHAQKAADDNYRRSGAWKLKRR